jgi:hypothetical protein
MTQIPQFPALVRPLIADVFSLFPLVTRPALHAHLSIIVSEIIDEAAKVGRVWKSLFGNTTVVPSIGNNDVFPHNQMFPTPNDVISNLSMAWQQFLAPPDFKTFVRGGYVPFLVCHSVTCCVQPLTIMDISFSV